MKKHALQTDVSVPQRVTGFIKLPTAQEAIQIGFTDQRVSPRAGLAAFAGFFGFLHWHNVPALLTKLLPHQPSSNNASAPSDTALGFIAGILAGACKLAQVATLRGDQALAKLLRVERLPSQSTLTRFFQIFDGAAVNLRTFDPLWRWCLERLSSRPGGYTLDLDSTQLLHEDHHHAEGIRTGHTPLGQKRCWNPPLGFLAEARRVCGFWLRPGNTVSFNNVIGCTLAMLERLPRYVRIGLVRADAVPETLGLERSTQCQHAAISTLCNRRDPQPNRRCRHHTSGRSGLRKILVASAFRKADQPLSQLQFSRTAANASPHTSMRTFITTDSKTMALLNSY